MTTRVLVFTVVGEGTSDRILASIFQWLLQSKLGKTPFIISVAEGLPSPSMGLAARVRFTQRAYSSDVVLIHRDSDTTPWPERVAEIENAMSNLSLEHWIPVVPVRMTEAWLLHDLKAIRRAAGNPSGIADLQLPKKARWELEPDPKQKLFNALRVSSEAKGRRLDKFNVHTARARLTNLIDDFSYLRGLDSFDDFERRIDCVLAKINVTMD